jgi:type II secretory pathway component PulF
MPARRMTMEEARQLTELLNAQAHLAECINALRVELVDPAWKSFLMAAAADVQRAAGRVVEGAQPFTKRQKKQKVA